MRALLSLLALLLIAPAASASGIFLKWDACHADGGVSARSFACDTNAGTETLVCSAVLDADFAGVTGIEAQIVGQSASGGVPAWWMLYNAGSCRRTALSLEASPAGPIAGCPSPFPVAALGGIGAYATDYPSAGGIQIKVACAVPPGSEGTVAAGQEYFLFALTISHAKTVGTGSCTGCSDPMCLGIGLVTLTAVSPTPAVEFRTNFLPIDQGHLVSWQNSAAGAVYAFQINPPLGHELGYAMTCSGVTAARRSTWGAVKSLYR